MHFIATLPLDLQVKAISLAPLGVSGFGWFREDALRIVGICRERSVVILGGDVLEIPSQGQCRYTYENWSIDLPHHVPRDKAVELSCNLAEDQLLSISDMSNSGNVMFDLVIAWDAETNESVWPP
jgi:hypothetical protein